MEARDIMNRDVVVVTVRTGGHRRRGTGGDDVGA